MNWEAIAAIGQMTGSAAVLVSLAYLAIQIKRSTAQAKSDAFARMTEMAHDFSLRLAADPEMARTLFTAAQNWNSVAAQSQFQAHMWNLVEVQLYESWHRMMIEGQIDEATYRSRESHLVRRIAAPGMRHWWDHYAYNLDPRFVARINDRLAAPASLPEFQAVPFFDVTTWAPKADVVASTPPKTEGMA